MAELPDACECPQERLYLATVDGTPAGCIALRPMGEQDCEMKRLYVRPEFRGYRLGKLLVEQIIRDAQELGYHAMYLDTLCTLQNAIAIYQKMGFQQIEPYYDNPTPGACFMCLSLQP